MTTTDKNILIAKFMGSEIKRKGQVNRFVYDIDWRSLMPVVEKIESMGHTVDIYRRTCYINISLESEYKQDDPPTKIEAVYNKVVKFIIWYNENKKHQTG